MSKTCRVAVPLRVGALLAVCLALLASFRSVSSHPPCTTRPCEDEHSSQEITKKNIRFIEYPGFPDAHSTWGSIGYSAKQDKVYVGVTNHRDRIALYHYDVPADAMTLIDFVAEQAHLRDFQWQGKIHSEIVEGPEGNMYFSTDGGESREEYLMNHPHGYNGGYVMKWDPAARQLTNLGMGLPYESVKDITVDQQTGLIYGISYPQAHFLVFDPDENSVRDLGRLGSSHVPRVVWSDQWGNGYYVDWRQRLVKYEREKGQLLFDDEPLPTFPGTPGTALVTGVTAYAKDEASGVIYLVTYGAKLVAFHPEKEGIGRFEDLGGIIDTGSEERWRPYCPNLAFGENGKLYYIVGGHGAYAMEDRTVLMEFDPETRTKRPVLDFPVRALSEATGSDITDAQGNIYFAGRRRAPEAESMGESGASRPMLIKFNPEEEVQP